MVAKASLHVVLSQGQSRNPEKRDLEAAILAHAGTLSNTEVLSIPHLYDLSASGESVATLHQCSGPIVVLSWLFPRAAHWVLDRSNIRGQYGEVLLSSEDDDEEDEDAAENDEEPKDRVIDASPRPDRKSTASTCDPTRSLKHSSTSSQEFIGWKYQVIVSSSSDFRWNGSPAAAFVRSKSTRRDDGIR